MLIIESKIREIKRLNSELEELFSEILRVEPALTRKIVSYQDNKNRSFYRWCKYKEAFSVTLVEYFLEKYQISKGTIFDPFAGTGTTLFAAALLGYDSEGIELLPIGREIISNRMFAQFDITQKDVAILEKWENQCPWNSNKQPEKINYLRITQNAYPEETERKIGQYLSELRKVDNKKVADLLFFALICILESISYTRKDGQYLRWDYRSGRRNGQNTFDKGKIYTFDAAICEKLRQIVMDIKNPEADFLFHEKLPVAGTINLYKGSCLSILPELESGKYKTIITSPPYCNRYDYTRTYALEHALLGVKEDELIKLRQTMLSCTVENKPKNLSDI
jgi:DNA methylase